MLVEIIIYITLFAVLFSGAFAATFQGVDAIQHLNQNKEIIDAQSFIAGQLDTLINKNSDWRSELLAESYTFSEQVTDTPTSTSKVLYITLNLNDTDYVFTYVQEK